MISELCATLRNYFLRDYSNPERYIHRGEFAIVEGKIQDLPFLVEGQYFRIVGSALNDGVYRYRQEENLQDETFEGAVWAMFVPRDFVALAEEIKTWKTENAAALNSPYQSESFGGYSYSMKSGGGAGASGYGWQAHFANRLNPYRRLSVL